MAASGSGNFVIDTVVRCQDGECGALKRLIVDPRSRALTHLVVTSSQGFDRLVPSDVVESIDGAIILNCALAEFEAFDEAVRLLPGGIDTGQSIASTVVDIAPPDEVSLSGGETVDASDGRVGRVKGLIADLADHHLTHVLLAEGHLWGTKEVAIPIADVTRFELESVQLNITKEQAGSAAV